MSCTLDKKPDFVAFAKNKTKSKVDYRLAVVLRELTLTSIDYSAFFTVKQRKKRMKISEFLRVSQNI